MDMKNIIDNRDNLKENEMTDFVTKVKVLLVNSKNEIMLAYSHNDYQFPGGTQEKGEQLFQTVKREIMEETGIKLEIDNIEPFACSKGYYKDWPEVGKNKKVEIYYYEVKTDEKPDLNSISLTEHEKNGNFCLKYIDLDKVEEEINKNIQEYNDPRGIGKEMLNLFAIYKDMQE